MNNSLSYREQRIAGELFPQYATELLFFLFETGRHDKQHTFTKGSQGYFSLKRQYIINFIVESEIENVFIEQRPPITSGDTALRSARLIAADFLHIPQKKIRNRLLVSIPIFILAWLVMMIDFEVLWRYFAWCNQTLAVFTLWALTVWLAKEHKCYWLTLIPALFMTMVTVTYIFFAQEGFRLSYSVSLGIAVFVTLLLSFLFIRFLRTLSKRGAIKK